MRMTATEQFVVMMLGHHVIKALQNFGKFSCSHQQASVKLAPLKYTEICIPFSGRATHWPFQALEKHPCARYTKKEHSREARSSTSWQTWSCAAAGRPLLLPASGNVEEGGPFRGSPLCNVQTFFAYFSIT